MAQPHLHAVQDDGGNDSTQPPTTTQPRATQRPKPTKNLPTDRIKFDMQIEVLRTFARMSGGKRPVGAEQIAGAMSMSANTAALCNGFFAESGWLERVGRGQYVATEPAVAYNRRMEFAATPNAVALLATPARSSWYWQALEPSLSGGRLSKNEALVILATEANTVEEHRPQLENVLQWLQFLGLARLEGEYVLAVESPPESDDGGSPPVEPDGETETKMRNGQVQPDKPDDRRPTSGRAGASGDVVIAFSTDLRLTSEDLAALNPDQIRALFEAVGTVAALTNRT